MLSCRGQQSNSAHHDTRPGSTGGDTHRRGAWPLAHKDSKCFGGAYLRLVWTDIDERSKPLGQLALHGALIRHPVTVKERLPEPHMFLPSPSATWQRKNQHENGMIAHACHRRSRARAAKGATPRRSDSPVLRSTLKTRPQPCRAASCLDAKSICPWRLRAAALLTTLPPAHCLLVTG